MKKTVILGMILLLLVACGQQAAKEPAVTPPTTTEQAPARPAATPEPAKTETAQPSTTPPQTTTTTEVTAPATPPPSQPTQSTVVVAPNAATLSPQLRDLLKRADEKVQSMQYLYGGTDTKNLFLDTYQVRGDKMKIKKYQENYYVRENYFDTVYVNQGLGCCEELSRCKSPNVDNSNKSFTVDVKTLDLPETPYQWTKGIKSGTVVGPQTFNDRSVTFVKYNNDQGNEVDLLIDDTYGVPHQVIIKDKDGNQIEKHQFNNLQFNTLKDTDFVAPCAP